MRESTGIALKSILILSLIIILFVGISCFAYKTSFRRKPKRNKSNLKKVNLRSSLYDPGYREGKSSLEIQIGPRVLPQNLTSANPDIECEINDNTRFYFTIRKIPSGEKIDWLSWEATVPNHKISDIEEGSTLYITEGGLFSEKEKTPHTRIHFSPRWGKNDDIVFVKMAFANGTLPYTESRDNTIAKYNVGNVEGVVTVPGIPEGSRLSLVVREKYDGKEKLLDTFRISQKIEDIYITNEKFSLLSSSSF